MSHAETPLTQPDHQLNHLTAIGVGAAAGLIPGIYLLPYADTAPGRKIAAAVTAGSIIVGAVIAGTASVIGRGAVYKPKVIDGEKFKEQLICERQAIATPQFIQRRGL